MFIVNTSELIAAYYDAQREDRIEREYRDSVAEKLLGAWLDALKAPYRQHKADK